MQGPNQMQFERKIEDAWSYLDQVKYKLGSESRVYNDFLHIMKDFNSQSIDPPRVIQLVQRVKNLFRGHPELIAGFNTFLRPGYRIEVPPTEQVNIAVTGPTSLPIHPTGPPTATPSPPHVQAPPTNHNQRSTGASPLNSKAHAAQMQDHLRMQFRMVGDALYYLEQVKYRFGSQPEVYNDFLDIMKEYKTQSIDKPGVMQRVSDLFRGHPDLIRRFHTFLPPENGIEVQPNEQPKQP